MKALKSLVCWFGVALTASAISVALAASGLPSGWTDDFAAAKIRAAAEGKKILLVFSGSDWCSWCVKFDKETLSKGEFVKAATKDFELVMVDSPKDKSKLSATARMQNPKLVAQYNVRGYPHYVVTDADGREIARGAGYVKGGPKAFLSKLEQMAGKSAAAAVPAGWKPRCNCGQECWEKGLCNCCKRNRGSCCRPPTLVKREIASAKEPELDKRDDGGLTCRQVACWTVCTEDPELSGKVDEVASFLEEILKAFDDETSGYFRTMQSYYDGILVHRNQELRGKRDRFIKDKCYLNLYAPDSLRDQSWCGLFCGGFLSRCKKEPLPDKEREALLLYVGARVTKKMGIDGGDRQLARFAQESNGMGRVLHELCTTNNAAVRRYYAAKVRLFETDRFGPFLSLSDMAEVFSAAAGCDAFAVFRQCGKRVRREDVSPKLRGFADEPFEEEWGMKSDSAEPTAVLPTAKSDSVTGGDTVMKEESSEKDGTTGGLNLADRIKRMLRSAQPRRRLKLPVNLSREKLDWFRDPVAAQEKARELGVWMFVYNMPFRGIRQNDFPNSDLFKTQMSRHYVLVMVDGWTPPSGSPKWACSGGWPDCRILDGEGKPVSSVGWWTDTLECHTGGSRMLLAVQGFETAIDIMPEAFAVVEAEPNEKGLEKLHMALLQLPEPFVNYHYSRWTELLVDVDSSGSRGWRKCYPYADKVLSVTCEERKTWNAYNRKRYELRGQLGGEKHKHDVKRAPFVVHKMMAREWTQPMRAIAEKLGQINANSLTSDACSRFSEWKECVDKELKELVLMSRELGLE